MDNIHAHIVGLNNRDKDKFVKDVKKFDYNVIDLNYITKRVKDNDYYAQIKEDRDKTKSKYEKNAINRCMFNYWKKKVTDSISKIKNDNKTIVIGLNSIDDSKLDIDTNNRFFLKHNLETNAKEIIKDNLDKYHDKILEGSFSLDFIDKDYLMQKRREVMDDYKKNNYKPITYDNLINFLSGKEQREKKDTKTDNKIYFASDTKYNKRVGIHNGGKGKRDALDVMLDENKVIYGYKYKWLALLSSINDHQKLFEKGFKNDRPYINIVNREGRKAIDKSCYLYELNPKHFTKASERNPYKYKTKSAEIINEWEIDSIQKEIKNCNVKIS